MHGSTGVRVIAEEVRARWPVVPRLVAAAVRWHEQVAADAVRDGAGVVVWGAAGFPGAPSASLGPAPHQAAALASPRAVHVYCDPDPEVRLLRDTAIAAAGEQGQAVTADASVRDPASVAAAAARAGGEGSPVLLQLVLRCGWLADEHAARVLGEYRRLLPPGSRIALTAEVPRDTPDGREYAGLLEAVAGVAPAHREGHRGDGAGCLRCVAGWITAAGLEPAGSGLLVPLPAGEAEPVAAVPPSEVIAALAVVPG